jgi:glycosyltransferase involved in cell wall biosynthesis
MRLLINAESLQPPLTGIGNYTRHLLTEYAALADVPEVHGFRRLRLQSLTALLDEPDAPAPSRAARHQRRAALINLVASHSQLPYRLHRAFTHWRFGRCARKLPADTVYHEPNFILQPYTGPAVATIHDLSTFYHPEYHPKARVHFIERHLQQTLERAAHLITPSALVRAELIRDFALPSDKVTAIPLGTSAAFRPLPETGVKPVLARYGLAAGRYLLCVATREPRKNLAGLCRAYAGLPAALRQRYPLVLAGGSGWHEAAGQQALQTLLQHGEARQLGYVPEADLPALYSGAALFAFPSFYEGFGLPVLEAMACGTAVVTSAGTAMEEVAGEAALLVPAGEDGALRTALQDLLEDPDRRRQLADAGLNRAKEFSWTHCARAHMAVFAQLT